MSVGDHHRPKASGRSLYDLELALKDKAVRQALARPIHIDRTWDIPYLAGYSKDGRTIYVDRHLPSMMEVGSRKINPTPFLLIHERTEKALIDGVRYEYAFAHELATGAEEHAVRRKGIQPAAYEKALHPFIKDDEAEPLLRVPADLDLAPYEGEEALLKRMKRAQQHPDRPGKVTKASVHYSQGMPSRHCGICLHFVKPHSCTVVLGSVSPSMWCERFKRDGR